jgi:multicomponent Na+:H+ antiporter subunit F
MNIAMVAAFGLLGAGALIGTFSLIKTRIAIEKMVALDVITTLMTGILLLFSFVFKNELVLDIAIVYAILSFGAVMVVARYRERGI